MEQQASGSNKLSPVSYPLINPETHIDPSKVRAVLYLRFSSENQNEQSIEGQRFDCLQYAKNNGYMVVGEYVDRAKTGTNDDRPGLQRMLKDSCARNFNMVLVWKVDRFARNRLNSLKNRDALKENGVRLVSVNENIDGDTPEGIITGSLLDAMAEYYSKELSVKVKRGIKMSVQKGHSLGGHILFGYKVVEKKYVIDEKEGPIVKEIFRMYVDEGMSMKAISDKLTSQGYMRNDGRVINHQLVEKTLTNPKYSGILKCSEWVNEEGIPAIVDKNTFQRSVERHDSRKHVGGSFKANSEFALVGRLFCSECGEMMIGTSGTSKSGKLHSYYSCKSARNKKGCRMKSIRKDDIEDMVIGTILIALKHPDIIKSIVDKVYSMQKDEPEGLSKMKERMKEVETKITNINNAIAMGAFGKSTAELLGNLEREKEDLEKQIAKLYVRDRIFTRSEVLHAIELMSESPIVTDAEKRAFCTCFIKKAIVNDNGDIRVYADLFGLEGEITGNLKAELPESSVLMGNIPLRQILHNKNLYPYQI